MYFSGAESRESLESGTLTVTPDLLNQIPVDLRSHNAKMLAAITAYIERRATNGQIDHLKSAVDGKELMRMSATDLQALRQKYQSLVDRESGKFPHAIAYEFRG